MILLSMNASKMHEYSVKSIPLYRCTGSNTLSHDVCKQYIKFFYAILKLFWKKIWWIRTWARALPPVWEKRDGSEFTVKENEAYHVLLDFILRSIGFIFFCLAQFAVWSDRTKKIIHLSYQNNTLARFLWDSWCERQ